MMANTVTIDHKTICPGLVEDNGWVLDGGCLGFGFATTMLSHGLRVLAVDPSPCIHAPKLERLTVLKYALVGTARKRIGWVKTDRDECCYTDDEAGRNVPARTIPQLMAEFDVDLFEVVKLNVEGAEYEIMQHWPGPIAKQITVSFHDFVPGRNPDPKHYYELMLAHLDKWYSVVQHAWTFKGDQVGNYWDSLFVLKDL